jgi:hypothetical protein
LLGWTAEGGCPHVFLERQEFGTFGVFLSVM